MADGGLLCYFGRGSFVAFRRRLRDIMGCIFIEVKRLILNKLLNKNFNKLIIKPIVNYNLINKNLNKLIINPIINYGLINKNLNKLYF